MKILVATHNVGKLREMKSSLEGLNVEPLSLEDLGIHEDYPEGGHSFEANAFGKARFYHALSKLPTVADDSGIFIAALENELGVLTRRWGAGVDANDEEWLLYFMERMKRETNRSARFVSVVAFVDGVDERIFKGETQGIITEKIMAPVKEGIPLSSVFLAEGADRVYSALTASEKNEISHRGKALAEFCRYLKNASDI